MIRKLHFFLGLVVLAGCATTTPVDISGSGSQLEARQIQTRKYDTLDKALTMRSVIATLQDLGFTIDQADAELGAITATRYHEYTMRMTVTVVQRGDERVSVRANARIGENAVTDAETYQDFFVALDKAMFLTLQRVD
ncbi:MAG: hypothetical protein QNJ07_02850 [Woeseiaceae bacterium]|nr:hypothetical protein [Woeseiaceae bacterium]